MGSGTGAELRGHPQGIYILITLSASSETLDTGMGRLWGGRVEKEKKDICRF